MCPDGRPMNKYFAPRFSVVLHDYSVSRGKPLSSVRKNYTTPPRLGQAFSFLFARFSHGNAQKNPKIQCKSPVKKREKTAGPVCRRMPEMTNYLIISCAKMQRNKRKRLTEGRGCIRIKITFLNDFQKFLLSLRADRQERMSPAGV